MSFYNIPADLSQCRILVTNDDGYLSTGIKILEKVARQLSRDVWVVAPESEQSAVSHSLTIRRPLRIRKLKGNRYCIDGTPTDSVMLAVHKIMKDKKPTLCLSGINRGANLGEDISYSGTVAAAMEATLLGVPAIALSQVITHPHPAKWATVEALAADTIRQVMRVLGPAKAGKGKSTKGASSGWPRNVLININFPDVVAKSVKGAMAAAAGRHKIGDDLHENLDPRGVPYYWIGSMRTEDASRKGTDIAAIRDGWITVTPLYLDLTHWALLRRMKTVMS
jgi:5'-nucleotidase